MHHFPGSKIIPDSEAVVGKEREQKMRKPFEGIRVVDLSTFVAAPVTGRLLADLGAEVIKVERPAGDGWRMTGLSYNPSYYTDEENPVFDIYNAGKKHVGINLKTPEGREAIHKLLATADVFITNTRLAALKRLGLSYEDLKEKYPRLVYGIVLGYGEEGPDAGKPAFDTSAFWARGGFLRDQAVLNDQYQPVQPPFSVGDTITGYLLMGEICAALYRREKTGEGDYVRSSLFHNSIFTMGTMAIITQPPYGRTMPSPRYKSLSLPTGDFQCADGEWVFLSGYNAEMNERAYKMLGLDDIFMEPRFATPAERAKNQEALYRIIKEAWMSQASDYWLEKALEYDLPLTRMGHYGDLINDEQAWANHYLENVTFRSGNIAMMPSSPLEMDSVGELTTKTAPVVGVDTDAIFTELGYTPEEIVKMRQDGAIK